MKPKKNLYYYLQSDRLIFFRRKFLVLAHLPIIRYLIPSELFIYLTYKDATGDTIDLNNPITYNQKIQWIKLNVKNDLLTSLSDKLLVRNYVKEKIGEKYLVPLIGAFNNANEITWDDLPNKFVVKTNHACFTNIICKDKKELNLKQAKKQLNTWLKKNYYWNSREWSYKHIKPKILCEEYLEDQLDQELKEYKIFCFHGIPKLIQLPHGCSLPRKLNFYDTSWNFLDVRKGNHPNEPSANFVKPTQLEEMLSLAKILSAELMHVRVDFYICNQDIYIGELTLSPSSGYALFNPHRFEIEVGNWLNLSKELN